MALRIVLVTTIVAFGLQGLIYVYLTKTLNSPGSLDTSLNPAFDNQIPCGLIQQQEQKQPKHNSSNSSSNPTTIFVISLQGVPGTRTVNDYRMDTFRNEWTQTCQNNSSSDDFIIEQCRGVLDAPGYRGYGVTTAFILCLNKAIDADQDMSMIFEDDARLFDSQFCNSAFQSNRFREVPSNAFLVMLGGHGWRLRNGGRADAGRPYKQVLNAVGAYGFAVPRANLRALRDDFSSYLIDGGKLVQGKLTLAADLALHKFALRRKQKVYTLDPLVVWHVESYSNTWDKTQESIHSMHPIDGRVFKHQARIQAATAREALQNTTTTTTPVLLTAENSAGIPSGS